jgi:hypothetical protein
MYLGHLAELRRSRQVVVRGCASVADVFASFVCMVIMYLGRLVYVFIFKDDECSRRAIKK